MAAHMPSTDICVCYVVGMLSTLSFTCVCACVRVLCITAVLIAVVILPYFHHVSSVPYSSTIMSVAVIALLYRE